ncbi:MAG: hypothetical protein WCE68_17870 [Anaerolineales bacterium]
MSPNSKRNGPNSHPAAGCKPARLSSRLRISLSALLLLAVALSALGGVLALPAVQASGNVPPHQVGTPSWWSGNGNCDDTNFYHATGVHAYKLGASWLGVPACGPQASLGTTHLIYFPSATWGEYEFECIELVFRFLYQEWGILPWDGNGDTIKDDYPSSLVFYADDGTHPIVPGDIITEDSPAGGFGGHAMIVTGVSVNASGTGSVSLLEQDVNSNGSRSLPLTKWVIGNGGAVDNWDYYAPIQGWLHVKVNVPAPTSTPTPTPTPGPPGVAVLDYPPDSGLITDYQPTLDWGDVAGADSYEVQIATNSAFSPLLLDQKNILHSSYPLPEPLDPDSTWYWRILAVNSLGSGPWSSPWSFRTAILPPGPVAPANTTLLDNLRPTFSWAGVSGASSYAIQVSRSNAFSGLAVNTSTSLPSYTPPADLAAGTLYYWRLQAKGPNGPSLYSPVWTFTTGDPPSIPLLISPGANVLVSSYTPTLVWTKSNLPDNTAFAYYQVQVAADPAFSSLILDNSTLTSLPVTSLTMPTLADSATYYWRVRAANAVSGVINISSWSPVRTFRTRIPAPVLLQPANASDLTGGHPILTWADDARAVIAGYTLQISRKATFTSLLVNAGLAGTATAYTPPTNLPTGVPIYWRVRCRGVDGPSLWSQVFSFTITP